MSYSIIFREPLPRWGLRGDPFLWDALGWHLAQQSQGTFPTDLASVHAAISAGLSELTGVKFLKHRENLSLAWLPDGGMSGGVVAPEVWRDRIVPTLLQRAGKLFSLGSDSIDHHPAEHRFRFAAWAAATAASRSRSVCSFTVEQGARLLRESPLKFLALGPHWLPDPQSFDGKHLQWCRDLMRRDDRPQGFSYGIAAKLINVYTKALFLPEFGGGWFRPYNSSRTDRDYTQRCEALHPPVDSVLLHELALRGQGGLGREWRQLRDRHWSNFDEEHYVEAIRLMKQVTGNRPWQIEALWKGHQS